MPMELILNKKKKVFVFLMCLRFLENSVLKLLDHTVYFNPYRTNVENRVSS